MTKPIILVKICYILLHVIQGVKSIFDSIFSQLALSLGHLFVQRWPSDKANHTCENMLYTIACHSRSIFDK